MVRARRHEAEGPHFRPVAECLRKLPKVADSSRSRDRHISACCDCMSEGVGGGGGGGGVVVLGWCNGGGIA